MKILLVGSFIHPMYAPAFELGFKKLGHEVRTIKYEDFLYGKGQVGQLMTRLQNRLHIGLKLSAYNKTIIREANSFHPDFIFLYRCYNVWRGTVKRLKKECYFIFTYNNDDPFSGVPNLGYYRNFKAILPLADVNLVYRKKNIADYESVSAKNVNLLLPYFIEDSNYYIDTEDTIPIAFLGHFESDGRDNYVSLLLKEKIPITVFNGSDWEKAPRYDEIKDVVKPGKRGAEYNLTLNQCQIALVFLSKLNHDTYTRRCFEIPATKTLMLCEYTEDMDMMFPADECAVYYRSKEELVQKCKDLLNHPDRINQIAKNGYKRLKEIGASEVDRCRQIVEIYNKYRNE